jgi:hypothetical protein
MGFLVSGHNVSGKAFLLGKMEETYTLNLKSAYKFSTKSFIQMEKSSSLIKSMFEDSGSISRK